MSEEIRLQPFGNEEYKVLVMGRADNRLSVFVKVGKRLLDEYKSSAIATLSELGYQGDQNHLMQTVSVAFYADICGKEDVPRTIFWYDDPKVAVLTKLRDVICYQKWGKTINQDPKIQEIFHKLNFGVVAEDPIGYARGDAVRALISATYGKETMPIVYFDQMRRYPAYTHYLFNLLQSFHVGNEIMEFDRPFSEYILERFEAAVEIINSSDNHPLKENLPWQKYIDDWDNYQYWLDKRNGLLDKPQ